MNTSSKNRVVIIAAVDETPASEHVAFSATALASTIPGAEVHFIHVVDYASVVQGPSVLPPLSGLLTDARRFVDGVKRAAAERFAGRIAAHIAAGSPARQILQLASDIEADLVIVGWHGKGALERLVQGSVSRAIVKKAACAVLIARPKDYATAPEIEPACPRCLEIQRTTEGDQLWCAQHEGHRAHGLTHYESSEGFGAGSMFIRP